MDNEMIERCKDAINAFPHWDFNNLEREQLALAVIKAMHEPTEKMVDKGGYTGAMTPHPHPLEGKYEPESRDVQTPLEAAAMSIAISLKRIADHLNERVGLM